MILQRVVLTDFRNFVRAELNVGPRFTLLWGHNGAGKTNIIEAIWLVSTLRSFRSSELGVVVRREATNASVELAGYDPRLDLPTSLLVRVQRTTASSRRTTFADGKAVRAAIDFYGRHPAVLFTPEDLGVLRGSPAERRQFLDRMLFSRQRQHLVDVADYEKLLRSRNHVLRDEALGSAERTRLLDTYDAGLAATGARIWTRREQLVHDIRPATLSAFADIHGATGAEPHRQGAHGLEVELVYRAAIGAADPHEREQSLLEGLSARRQVDTQRGMTTVGPHRDDLVVNLDGAAAANYASQGQSRALVLALKLAELSAAEAQAGEPPLLLLDDVSSELDPARSALLYETLSARGSQCIITTTARHHVTLPPSALSTSWRVDQGRLEKE